MSIVKRPLTKKVKIYVLKDPRTGGVRYVGKTKHSLSIRLSQHVCLHTQGRSHKWYWLSSLLELGLKPIIEQIETCLESEWTERETVWIAYYKKYGGNLTNSTDGGEGMHNPSASTRQKIRDFHLQYRHTEESKAKIGAAAKGRMRSAESIAKTVAFHTGRKRSDLTKQRISAVMKGKQKSEAFREACRQRSPESRKHSAETKAKISASNKGKKRTKEFKANLSKLRTGVPLSENHKAKISEGLKKRFLNLNSGKLGDL